MLSAISHLIYLPWPRNNPICVASLKVAMASTMVVTSVGIFARDIALNIANVNPTMPRVVLTSVVMLSVLAPNNILVVRTN